MSEEVKSVSIKRMKEALRHALDKADPNLAQYPEIKRARINWPMKPFTDELKKLVTEFKQFRGIYFEFTEEQIESQLTTCILKAETFRVKLSFDCKSSLVACFCVGKDFDGVAKDFPVTDLVESVRELMPKRKVVVIKRKPTATV
jgi:hypothetical protein